MAATKSPAKGAASAKKPAAKASTPAPAKGSAAPKKGAAAAPAKVEEAVRPSVAPTAEVKTHSFRRRIVGVVTSDKMDKTVVVEAIRYSRDPMYKKYVKRRTKYKAHDERNEYKTGDRVEIQENAPISREKRFLVVRLVARPVVE
jgi:small subunit ribosomal protein S17